MVMKKIAILSILLLFASCIKEKNDFIELKVGDRLPEFAVVMNDGSIVSDQSLSGTVSVVVFFHTGCPDCQRTLPSVQKVYDEHCGDAVQFALISRAQTEAEIAPYWEENGYTICDMAVADDEIITVVGTLPLVSEGDQLTVRYPRSAVLFLRHTRNTPDVMHIYLETSQGRVLQEVRVMKLKNYTLDEIFEKRLYLLLPFYILVYENRFEECNENAAEGEKLIAEYRRIAAYLGEKVSIGDLNEYERNLLASMILKV